MQTPSEASMEDDDARGGMMHGHNGAAREWGPSWE